MILVDTNVLIYAINLDAPQHAASRALVEAVRAKRVAGVLVPQVLLEFFAVVTDPRRVANPLNSGEAWRQIDLLRAVFPVLDPGPKTLEYLGSILAEKETKDGDIFDAYLVAQMRACGVSLICTYNVSDFMGYAGIVAHTPEAVLSKQQESTTSDSSQQIQSERGESLGLGRPRDFEPGSKA